MQEKHCPDCNITKPISEFYFLKHRDKYNKRCKPCHQILSKGYIGKSKPPEHETYVIAELNKRGIVSDNAKHQHKKYALVDVLAWGCVRIECKLLVPDSLNSDSTFSYSSGVTEKQRISGFLAEVICLVLENNLYLFEPNHPAFYIDGKLRTKILYNPDSLRSHVTDSVKLTADDMGKALNRFELIEQKRLEISKERMQL